MKDWSVASYKTGVTNVSSKRFYYPEFFKRPYHYGTGTAGDPEAIFARIQRSSL